MKCFLRSLVAGCVLMTALPVQASVVHLWQLYDDVMGDNWTLTGNDWSAPGMPVDELGNRVGPTLFPTSDWITSSYTTTPIVTWPDLYQGGTNYLVSMTNMTGRDLSDLYYIADDNTSITNYDENIGQSGSFFADNAFRIDRVGLNHTLTSESMAQDGIFQAGETWQFVLQDYLNTQNLAPSLFGSFGVAEGSVSDLGSSGSIITTTMPVPEPATLAVLGLGFALALSRRRARS